MSRATVRIAAVVAAGVALSIVGIGSASAAKKLNVCTLVAQSQLETAFGNAFDAPQDSSSPVAASCRYPSKDISGADLNLFVSNDVKGGIKDSIGSYFATKKSFQKIYGQANPVKGVGKEAYSAFDDTSSVAQGSLLVLDGKNHAALVLATGSGLTADDSLAREEAVAKIVLPKIK
jgi:hypothetical protein